MIYRHALACLVLCSAAVTHAENFDVYPFVSPEEEARFERLTHELRCPKCQNQSIADSNAPIAQDLRQRTYELVNEGKSDDEIVAYLKERYGEFITYRPPFNFMTAALWAGPFVLLGSVLVVLLWRRGCRDAVQAPATAETHEKAGVILSRYDAGAGKDPEPRP